MGGYVALQLDRTCPGRFTRLVLTNTRSLGDSPDARTKRLAAAARMEESGASLPVEETVRGLVASRTERTHPEIMERVRQIVRLARPDRLGPDSNTERDR